MSLRKNSVRERLKTLQMGQTTEQFAERCGLGGPTLRKYLTGERYPEIEQLQIIASRLNVSLDWLVGGHLAGAQEFTDDQVRQLCAIDPEVIEIDDTSGRAIPVVRTYDDEKHHLQYFCIHCGCWHFHGRGGPEYPYTTGRGGMAGDRRAHCFSKNSPFLKNGVILDVVGSLKNLKKRPRSKLARVCEHCREYYSAAFNACSCGYIGPKRQSTFREAAELYQKVSLRGPQVTTNLTSNTAVRQTGKEWDSNQQSTAEEQGLIAMMLKVIRSQTMHSASLVANIRSFNRAVEKEKENSEMNEEIKELREQVGRIEELLLSLRAESNPEKKRASNDH